MLSTVCYSCQSCQQLVKAEKVWMSSQCKFVPKMTIPVQSQLQPAKWELRSRSIRWSHLNANKIKMKNSTGLLGHDKSHLCCSQRPARFSFLENSRELFFIFTSRSRSRAISISLSLLEKEWRDFTFHFSLLGRSVSYLYFTLFLEKKSEIRCGV